MESSYLPVLPPLLIKSNCRCSESSLTMSFLFSSMPFPCLWICFSLVVSICGLLQLMNEKEEDHCCKASSLSLGPHVKGRDDVTSKAVQTLEQTTLYWDGACHIQEAGEPEYISHPNLHPLRGFCYSESMEPRSMWNTWCTNWVIPLPLGGISTPVLTWYL